MKIKTIIRPLLPTFILCLLSLCSHITAKASGLSLAAGKYDHFTYIGNHDITLSPTGYSLSAYFDVSESITASLNYGRYSDEQAFLAQHELDYEKDVWGIGISHYSSDWSVSARYDHIDENLNIQHNRSDVRLYQEELSSPSVSLSASYYFSTQTTDEPWHFTLSSSLLYNDWTLDTVRVQAPLEDQNVTTGIKEGDNTFTDISLSVYQIVMLTAQQSINYGGAVVWNHLLSGESNTVSRNGRSVNQLVSVRNQNRSFLNSAYFSQSIEGNEYGIASLFITYIFSPQWSVDLDYSRSFAANNNSASSYLSLNYQF